MDKGRAIAPRRSSGGAALLTAYVCGVVFAAAVAASVWRDRLLALPDRARRGEGVFAVLTWR